jgi:hypothetical protein
MVLKYVHIIKKKVKGSIVEPVIAIVLLVLTMAMAFVVLTRTNNTPKVQAINLAGELINQEIYNTITNTDFLDKSETVDAFTLIKEVSEINDGQAAIIKLQVQDKGGKLITKTEFVVPINSNDKEQ